MALGVDEGAIGPPCSFMAHSLHFSTVHAAVDRLGCWLIDRSMVRSWKRIGESAL